jgi:hypothetical protein
MVITAHIDKWDVNRVLVDNGSQAKILFLSAFNQMGYDRGQLREATKPLYGFSIKRIEPVGVITLPVSFGSLKNPRTKYITFDVVNIHNPYNAIFGRGLLNTFEVAFHSAYLCLKVPASLGVISIHDSQKDDRNIEQGFAPGHKNVHFLWEASDNCQQDLRSADAEGSGKNRKAVEADCETKRAPLDPRIPNRIVLVRRYLSPREEAELLSFLDKNSDVFAWSTSDLVGVSRDIVEYKLYINPSTKPRKQKLSKMTEEKVVAAKAEV